MSERERVEWLAYDLWRQARIVEYTEAVLRPEYPDAGSLTALLVAELG